MAKRYATTYSTGLVFETSSCHEANNIVCYDDQQKFALSGVPVSAEDFYAAANQAVNEAWEKKSKTHKRVRVLYGSSAASYVTKWVRR
jgi:hypothetical protein